MFPRHSAFKQEQDRIDREGLTVGRAVPATGVGEASSRELKLGSTKKFGVTEVPTHVLEQLNDSLRRMAGYTNLPTSLREELEGLADEVYSQLR